MTVTPAITLIAALILFLLAVRLSAFYSGSETGFYRVSPMRLSIQAQQGNHDAQRLQQFLARPEQFVATTLVGNNIANYLTTVALGLSVSVLVAESTGVTELVATVLVTPVVFIFGELIPKSLFYRAPSTLLARGVKWFWISSIVFLPLTFPLIVMSRWIARLGNSDKQPLELVLSRPRLGSVLEAGHKEGLLTELQAQLADNIMQTARQPVVLSMVPVLGCVGTVVTSGRDELLELARRTRSTRLLLHPPGKPRDWTWYVRVADLFRPDQSPRAVATQMPRFSSETPKVEVLAELVRQYSAYGAIEEEGRVIGVVSRRTLLAQLQRRGPRWQLPESDQ
ncbi:MAG: DUF21 domain-containing protein [Planctomycetaceae bacterium]|nr:DUF21 domain-containing protein [Planctomycetaceae bacterium]